MEGGTDSTSLKVAQFTWQIIHKTGRKKAEKGGDLRCLEIKVAERLD
jgi:hypothetical protein